MILNRSLCSLPVSILEGYWHKPKKKKKKNLYPVSPGENVNNKLKIMIMHSLCILPPLGVEPILPNSYWILNITAVWLEWKNFTLFIEICVLFYIFHLLILPV